MAKGKGSIKGWITRNGVHIPIYGEYTVRGGQEPKAKGAKFKRKRPDNLKAKDIYGEERTINRKDLEGALAEAEAKAKAAINENEWRQYEDEAKNLREALDGKEVDRLIATNYGKLSDKEKPSISKEGKNPVTKAEEQGSRYHDKMTTPYKDLNDKQKSFVKELAEERAGHELSDEGVQFYQDLENDERSIRQTQIKERESKQLREIPKEQTSSSKYDKVSPGGALEWSGITDRGVMEAVQNGNEAGLEEMSRRGLSTLRDYQNFKNEQASSKAANGAPRVTDEEALSNKEVEWNGQRYQTRASQDWDREKNQEYTAGHLYVPIDPEGDVKQFFVAQDGSVHGSASEYLNKRAAARRAEKSSTPTSTPERKRYKSDGLMQAFKSAKEMTGRSDLEIHQLAQDGLEDHYSFRDKEGNEVGTFSNPHTSKKGYMTLNAGESNTKQDSLSASMNERSRIRGELHAKDKAMAAAMPTTVSGLRSAYADATGQMKSKIAAELRRKGYTLVGGKWVKGSKS